MYRFLSRTVCSARKPSLCVYESCLAKCEKVSRASNGVGLNALSTSSFSFCEKKINNVPINQDEADIESGQAKVVEREEDAVALRADDGSTTQQQADVTAEQVLSKPKQVETIAAGSRKDSLLDLLGAMKVDVTSKRKLKNLRTMQSFESDTQNKSKKAVKESIVSVFQEATVEASESDTLEPDLVAAASAAAATLPNSSQVESELLKQLRQRKALTEAQKKGNVNDLGEMIADMKVGKNFSRHKSWAVDQIQFDDDGRGYTHSELDNVGKRRHLFSSKRLNIFSPKTDKDILESTLAKPTLWDMEFVKELSMSTNQMPRNGLEEMIQWTKEGKLWEYPINNEMGLEEEANIPFHEHVFLEKHLEEGFPRHGPVRHFMELVVTGLSKNPFLTVQQKKEHIFWFRDYFHQKEEVLNEADVYLS